MRIAIQKKHGGEKKKITAHPSGDIVLYMNGAFGEGKCDRKLISQRIMATRERS